MGDVVDALLDAEPLAALLSRRRRRWRGGIDQVDPRGVGVEYDRVAQARDGAVIVPDAEEVRNLPSLISPRSQLNRFDRKTDRKQSVAIAGVQMRRGVKIRILRHARHRAQHAIVLQLALV